jgi:hypothetical protein
LWCWTKAQHCACAPVTRIASYKDFVVLEVIMVDCHETVPSNNESFDRIESLLVFGIPARPFVFAHLCRQWRQNSGMVRKVRQELV